jgi:L-cysteine:1D-myo-inositol 2-amino-2-deoxy-alpha-D-glucopyranoside ligase
LVSVVVVSILPLARELGVPYLELAASELARFRSDMDSLGMRPPMAEPRATEAIDGMIELINALLESDHAYLTHGTVFFDVSTFPRFGELSHYPREHMVRLARARGGNPDDPHRRDPLDFVLWQPSLADEPAWRAPFGVGRPGWHIECSVMAMATLGPTLDLHGGGTDLIFPHHECEIAQSESVTGKPFVRHWMHSAMVSYEGEKMSKSLGNLVFVSDLLERADPRAIRLALMHHHYRAGFEWHDTDLDEGTALLHRLVAAAKCDGGADPAPFAARVRGALDADLDAPRAIEALDDLASAVLSGGDDRTAPAVLRELGSLLGLDLSTSLA